MDADGGRMGDIADVVRVIRTECARLTRPNHDGQFARTVFLEHAGRYDERPADAPWSWKPVDCPGNQLMTQMSWSIP